MLCFSISTLFYFFFDAQQLSFKLEADINIRTGKNIEVVTLPAAEFLKCQSGDELWLNGALYDIKSYSIENGIATVSVYHDTNEEGLVKNLSGSFDQDNICATDNGVHLSKHRLHMPDEGKVLVAPTTITHIRPEKTTLLFCLHSYGEQLIVSCVIKPPPDNFFV
jgi:hypothetical protein